MTYSNLYGLNILCTADFQIVFVIVIAILKWLWFYVRVICMFMDKYRPEIRILDPEICRTRTKY